MADFGRVEMGAGAWMSKPTGDISYSAGLASVRDVSQEEETTNPYIWIYLKHPIPIIPNLRLEYTSIESEGRASGQFANFDAGTNSVTKIAMTQYDVIPYYNLLDNTFWITLDIGVDIKIIDLTYDVSRAIAYSKSTMVAIPMLYTRARVQIPGTNLGIEADARYTEYDDSKVYDARIKVDYTFDITPIIQPAIEVGYRVQTYELNDSDFGGVMNLEFSGVYVGAIIRF